MKKVLFLIHGMSTGGAETLVKDYILKLNKDKFDVVLLCFYHCFDSPYEKILEESGVKTIYIDKSRISSKNVFIRLYMLIRRYILIRKNIKVEKPDILHSHLRVNSYVKFARPNKNCKIFHTVHNEPKKLWFGSSKKQYDLKCAKYLVKKYNMRFIVLHEDMRNEINNLFEVNNSIILNNGIDFSRFDASIIKNNKDFKEELNIPIDSFVIGNIGRFSKQKNQEFLIEVFSQLVKIRNNSFLLLIGTGAEKKNLENKLSELGLKDKYLILSNRGDIPDLLGIMDIFVFPSIYEGLGIVLIEAQKMNLPCFISDKVPKAAEISNLVTRISLNKSAMEWTNIITKYKYPKKIVLKDKEWDMNEVVKKLEKIYEDKI